MKVLFIVYDNESHISFFPLGISYLASACRNAGHDVSIYNQDVYHYSDEHLKLFLQENQFDMIGVGACGGYYQYRKIAKISQAVRDSGNTAFFLLGGHLVSADPVFFVKKYRADAVAIGESEVTVVELLQCLEQGRKQKHFNLGKIEGLAWLGANGEVIVNKKRKLVEELETIATPAYDLFPIDHYALMRFPNAKRTQRTMPILSGRGCPFQCNFCYRMDKGIRMRDKNSIVAEIRLLQENYGITYFYFADELLMSSEKRIAELCETFEQSGLAMNWWCNGRLNYAKKETLETMKKAGCVFINYGIESVNDEALRKMNKNLTVKQILEGVENTLAVGISPGLNIIFGNIDEDEECLRNDVEFLLKYDDHSQLRTIRPVTPYPGSPLFAYAVKKGLIKDTEDFYERLHINSDLLTVNFTKMSDEEYYSALYEANMVLLDNYTKHARNSNKTVLDDLYIKKDVEFRGFRHV